MRIKQNEIVIVTAIKSAEWSPNCKYKWEDTSYCVMRQVVWHKANWLTCTPDTGEAWLGTVPYKVTSAMVL